MTIQVSRRLFTDKKARLVPLGVLALTVACAGCRLDLGVGAAERVHPIAGRSSVNPRYAESGSCSGFHPTVWHSWQEGPMGVRCDEGRLGTVRIRQSSAEPLPPVAPQPPSEPVPAPQPQKHEGVMPPGAVQSSPVKSLPAEGTGSGGVQVPVQVKDSVPAGTEPARIEEKPAEKAIEKPIEEKPAKNPPILPVLSRDRAVGPATVVSWNSDPGLRLLEDRPNAGSGNSPKSSEPFPKGMFTHGRVPPSSSSDPG